MNKNNTVLYLILILILGVLLRLWNIDKPEGMWNDEYLTWSIANLKFPTDFFKGVANNCHAPLHYFYLKGWMFLFRDSDVSLRVSSLVPGVISIFTMFLCEKAWRIVFSVCCIYHCDKRIFNLFFPRSSHLFAYIFNCINCFVLLAKGV